MPILNRIQIIDFLRGISIFTIVLMHFCQGYASGVLSKALAFGGAGVHVFILCSGLGLYLSYLRKPIGYKDFLRKRFAKVYVPYAIAVLLWGLWLLVSEGTFPVLEVASHLLLYKMFSVELDTSLCGPYWFISTIIQFYLAWPLIVRLVRCGGGTLLPLQSVSHGVRW
jgi:peptidoglycan/LPS O-acetylase OafA/YrhL